MSSIVLIGALLANIVSTLWNIWFFAIKKGHSASELEGQTEDPVSLPKGWYTNAERFQAERRAIFSQTWTCVSHRGRFKKPGDYIVYDVAGFRILMILGKDKTLRFIRETDINFLRETLDEAHRLEHRIFGYRPLDATTIVVLGDPHTTPEHFKILDEVFWYTSLLQLYRVFPDLLIQRYQPWNPQNILQAEAASHVPSRDETEEWLMKLALHILAMLQSIPLDSRTRSIQAPIIVALSSELRYKSPDVSRFDTESEAGYQETMSPSNISHSVEIARARRFVMSRLSIYWHVLPLQKVKKYQILVKHIWEALDSGVPDVYWADMLSNNELRTVMG
ncbi:hypothetical protein FPOA_03840 [Fusarium poae]|uniref:Uncharacterized protein n=1 Tax=Fusarium poae TaxID=36050 RepID=A0A1B8ARX7_FUSPO|nr:hypothetical protein FPOA_03840 [Fusarium poae]